MFGHSNISLNDGSTLVYTVGGAWVAALSSADFIGSEHVGVLLVALARNEVLNKTLDVLLLHSLSTEKWLLAMSSKELLSLSY